MGAPGATDPRWCDDHCHLGMRRHGDPEPTPAERSAEVAEAVAAARAEGVERLVCVGTTAADSALAIEAAAAHEGVFATVGVHPHEATEGTAGIVALLDRPGVVAVGECGLDYHYDHSPREVQRRVFAEQVALANERGLALVVHTRDAWDDTLDVLVAEGVPERTVIHCFSGGPEEARRCLDLGAHLSFSGIVTFPSAGEVREAAAACPLDRLLVETDAPYLAPVPHRGRPNRPALLPLVGVAVAGARGVPVADVAAATWANAEAVYRLG